MLQGSGAKLLEEERMRKAELKKQEAEQRRADQHRSRIDSILLDGPLMGWELPKQYTGHHIVGALLLAEDVKCYCVRTCAWLLHRHKESH